MIETKQQSTDVFATDDEETRLRELIMKFQKIQKIPLEIREEAKTLMRELNTQVEEIQLTKQYSLEKEEKDKGVPENQFVGHMRKKRKSAVETTYKEMLDDEVTPTPVVKGRRAQKAV